MSEETTFERDTSDRECVEDVLLALSEELSYRLWFEGCRSRCLCLKLRLQDFSTLSRRQTRSALYRSSSEVFKDALTLLDKAWDGRTAIRLLGLCFVDLEDESSPIQGELFAESEERSRRAESAVFELERKGIGKVTRARLIGREARGHRAEE
jgi:DNA polymerase-4